MSANKNIIEEYIFSVVKTEVDKQKDILESTLKEEDANKIVSAIIPHLDLLISKRIKQHLNEIAQLIIEKFKNEEII